MATSTSTPNFDRSFCAAYNLMMMLTCTVLNNENVQYEAFTAIIKVFGSHLQVEIVQTVKRVTQCLWANIGEKSFDSIASWCNVTSYTEFPCYKLNGLYVPITWPNKIFGRTFTLNKRNSCLLHYNLWQARLEKQPPTKLLQTSKEIGIIEEIFGDKWP